MTVLGLSCWYHDAAAALVRDGRIVAAAQEERFTRRKHDAEFPAHAVAYVLAEAGLTAGDLDAVAFYDKPLVKFERLLETYLTVAPRGLRSFLQAMPVWIKQKLWAADEIRRRLGYDGRVLFPEHHESHAASAFFPSPHRRAAVLTIDGVGEWATTSWGVGDGASLDLRAELHFPHSLGLLYSAFTTFCGFRVHSGEYKLMGLAPYGTPRYAETIRRELVDLRPDGSFRLDQRAFTYTHGTRMTGAAFERLFDGPPRAPEGPLTQREMDLAASVQVVTEEIVLAMARHVHAETGERALCLAGGVALNCVANGRLLREGPFDALWVQPAAGDAGGALGAALAAAHVWGGTPRDVQPDDAMQGSYLGPAFADDDCRAALDAAGLPYEAHADADALAARVAGLLADGLTVGWFQGRAEFGPRALGARSILADARRPDAQRRVNLQIKFRESFRPFAPSVLEEHADEYFDLAGRDDGRWAMGEENVTGRGEHVSSEPSSAGAIPPSGSPSSAPPSTVHRPSSSPYMLLVGPVRDAVTGGEGLGRLAHVESRVPAVTHVDGSARVQTVTAARNGLYHTLLAAFFAQTGCPVLVNTSFNVRGEPIVHAPADAVRVFRRTHMDALALGPYVVTKASLPDAAAHIFTPEEIAATYGLD